VSNRRRPADHQPSRAQEIRIRQQLMDEAHRIVEEVIEDDSNVIQMPPKPSDHTVLEIWQKVLGNIDLAKQERITTTNAFKVLHAYPFLAPKDLVAYYAAFYYCLEQYRDVLAFEIDTDDKCLEWTDPELDAENNRHHYTNLMVNWQRLALSMRTDWVPTSENAGAELAALSDSQSFMLGEKGIINLLSQLKLDYDQTDADEVYALAVAGYEQEG
jgi:hypothetical protein